MRTPSPGDRGGDLGGGLILRHVARLEPRDRDLADPGRLHGGHLHRPDPRALLEDEPVLADRVHGDAALGLAHRNDAEFHDRSALGPDLAQPRGDLRHDGDRDLRRRDRADGEADRRVDAGDRRIIDALLL